jgi:acetyl-CoA carboxylase carboxyl transferase subunit alpha
MTAELPENESAEGENFEAFERVKLARHPERPYALDLINELFKEVTEIHGDRRYADDTAVLGGFARYHGEPVAFIGQQKGRDTKQRRFRNFGMPKPEGYRKALRIMKLAEKFGRPIITFIDTPGAYPGIDAEERGQAEAIALNLMEMVRIEVPIVVLIIGEGGSGGALAIALGDQILMLENAIYSVITPEGCAAILWKDASQAPRAAKSLRLTAGDLKKLNIVDKIVREPGAGAHSSLPETVAEVDSVLKESLSEVSSLSKEGRIARRYRKLRLIGSTLLPEVKVNG